MDITGRRPEDSGSLSYEMPATDLRYLLDRPHQQRDCLITYRSVGEQIASRRVAIFGHIASLSEEVPAHKALRAHVDLSLGRLPGRDWKRRPGRPNATPLKSIRSVTTPQHTLDVMSTSHSPWPWLRSDAMALAGYANMMMMMMMMIV